MKFRRRNARPSGQSLRLFYASDMHGSDVCWRKFVNAAGFYRAQALILGGDLAGKALVPIVADGSFYRAVVLGEQRRIPQEADFLEGLERDLRDAGLYPWRTTAEELKEIQSNDDARDALFLKIMEDELHRWLDIAHERLAPMGVTLFAMAGNDDPFSLDDVINEASGITFCDERVVSINSHELLSFSWSNRTPFRSHRELDEDELYRRLRRLCDQLESPGRAIFNLHVPPYGSGLDTAAELDETLRPVVHGGILKEIPVGSTAVRQLIEEVQPALAVHGHIHESRGVARIGRTIVANPGSEYGAGRLHGLLAELRGADVIASQLVSG